MPNDTQHQNTHPKTSPIDHDGVWMTNEQSHMISYIHIIVQAIMNYKSEIYIWNQSGK